MRTIKQVSDLTGVSVRMLHYYDEIRLLKPSAVTEAGYRLYDDKALETLQQILFFKELDIPLKEVKEIMVSPYFDKMQALENQKKILILKRDRLNGLIGLINKTLKGDNTMSFKEFDMTKYYNVWIEFKKENKDRVIKTWGSIGEFDKMIEQMKHNETKLAKNAIKLYGSIENFTESTRKDLNNDGLIIMGEKYDEFEKDFLHYNHPVLKELYKNLTIDLNKDPTSNEIQQIAKEITDTVKKDYEIFKMDRGDNHWYIMMTMTDRKWREAVDNKYGKGAAKFIKEVFKIYLRDKQPKLDRLYEKLVADLSKDSTSKEIQQIVEEIADTTKSNYEHYHIDMGINCKAFLSNMADIYLSNANKNLNVVDKKFTNDEAKFIGESLKIYSENNK
ncbi:MerR family transcriptional regulator [Acetobacterium paludosum]|uniref:MerR family transcriptional regulator n=1 Tax=Acetobacterium paludosum TaxID=52693 RepID=A0A923KYA4_9FIRM|nr:MerR family transcriptional regulator [Acetobacterium paludosum]MBC3889416.1 MerR family transcriptional regulator [Acetobacterium paludosum]